MMHFIITHKKDNVHEFSSSFFPRQKHRCLRLIQRGYRHRAKPLLIRMIQNTHIKHTHTNNDDDGFKKQNLNKRTNDTHV